VGATNYDALNTDLVPLRSPHNFCHRNGHYTARLDRCYVRKFPYFSSYISTLHQFPTTHNLSDHIPTVTHPSSLRSRFQRGSSFWRLNQKRLNPHSIAALSHSLAHFAPSSNLCPFWPVGRRSSSSPSPTSLQPPHSDAKGQGSGSRAITQVPSPNKGKDPLQAQYKKRLLLARITADKAKELPSPLLTRVIDDRIAQNHIPAVVGNNHRVSTAQVNISNVFGSHFAATYSPKLLSHSNLFSIYF